MDTSQRISNIASGYGGSDITRPSFNRTQYVQHGSIVEPLHLGFLDDQDFFIDGEAGAEHGASTIFYQFSTKEPLQIAARIIPVDPASSGLSSSLRSQFSRPTRRIGTADAQKPFSSLYLYISVSLTDAAGRAVETGHSAFRSLQTEEEQPRFTDIPTAIGYANSGYWDAGYAEQDEVMANILVPVVYLSEFDAITVQSILESEIVETQTIVGPLFVSPVLRYRPLDPGRAALTSPLLPPGEFTVAVSNSQWQAIPYTLQLALRAPTVLRGTALLEIRPQGRFPISKATGEATLNLDARGFICRTWNLEGASTLELRPTAQLRRTSPFG